MSERPSDECMTSARLQALNLKFVTREGLTRDETIELLAAMDRKDAAIKALADALRATRTWSDGASSCWCAGAWCGKHGRDRQPACEANVAALHLAGRVP